MNKKRLEPCHCGCPDIEEKKYLCAGKLDVMVLCTNCGSKMPIRDWVAREKYRKSNSTDRASVDMILSEAHSATKEAWNGRIGIEQAAAIVRRAVVSIVEGHKSGMIVDENQWIRLVLTVGGIMAVQDKKISAGGIPKDTDETIFVEIPRDIFSSSKDFKN